MILRSLFLPSSSSGFFIPTWRATYVTVFAAEKWLRGEQPFLVSSSAFFHFLSFSFISLSLSLFLFLSLENRRKDTFISRCCFQKFVRAAYAFIFPSRSLSHKFLRWFQCFREFPVELSSRYSYDTNVIRGVPLRSRIELLADHWK